MKFLKNIFSPKGKPTPTNLPKETDNSECEKEDITLDERFVKKFIDAGGKFLYSESPQETLENFNQILNENDWFGTKVCCYEEELKVSLSNIDLEFTNDTDAMFYLATCEFLISDIGGILLTNTQLKDTKTSELPNNIIIFAKTSQIIENIDVGLQHFKKTREKIPTNISTVRQFGTENKDDFLSYGSMRKNLYLLLLENL